MQTLILLFFLMLWSPPVILHSNLDQSLAIPPNIVIIGTGLCPSVALAHELYHLQQFRNPSRWRDLLLYHFDQFARHRIESEADEYDFQFVRLCYFPAP